MPHGENHHNAKLTIDKVRSILKLRKEGKTVRQVAKEVGSSLGTVADVITGRSWTRITKLNPNEARRVGLGFSTRKE
jgi:IS30 family transposase